MKEKEYIISVRYGQTNLSLGSLFGITRQSIVMPKTVTLGTDLSVRTIHSCQIPIFFLCVSIILLSIDNYIFIPEKKETHPQIMKKYFFFSACSCKA